MADKKFSYRQKAKSALGQVYDYAQEVSENHESGTSRSVHGVAASVANLGIKGLSKSLADSPSDLDPETSGDFLETYEDEKRRSHFADDLLRMLLTKGLDERDPERKVIESRMNDPERAKRPGLSPRIIYRNFRNLASRMSALFAAQYGIIHIITWRKPTKTLTVLVLYTWLCLWPHLILAYPLIFLLCGVLIPGYLYRHPQRTPEFIKVKKRGQSLFQFFNQLSDSSIIEDMIQETGRLEGEFEMKEKRDKRQPTQPNEVDPKEANSQLNSEDTTSDALTEINATPTKKGHFKSEVTLLMNMTDLQNLTTDIVQGYDAAEIFWYQTGGFKDEGFSTLIFYLVILATSVVLFFGPYIPWRLIFIQTGWAVLLLCHPNAKKHIQKFQKKPSTKRRTDFVKQKVEKVERQDIIVDGDAEKRKVEIFELQRKSPLSDQWEFYMYTSYMFDSKNPIRASGKRPIGVDHLSKVQPPATWKFDIGYVNEWVIDENPIEFIISRSLDIGDYIIPKPTKDNNEGWIYDNIEELDSQYEFRRRRLYRESFRYSKPAREPKQEE